MGARHVVLAFEGQGATSIPGDPVIDLTALPPAAAQQAIITHQLARARAAVVADADVTLVGVVGQSLGELSALVTAGALAEDDALELARLRAELPAALLPERPWTMASMTRLAPDRAEEAATGLEVWVAGRNTPQDCIVVGITGDFATFVERLGAPPHTYRELPVVAPYHTPAMAPVAEALGKVVADLEVLEPVVPVVTPIGPGEVRTPDEARAVVVAALTSPVAWSAALTAAAARWPDAAWRECGPSYSLHRFVWKNGLDLDWGEA